MYSDEDIDAAVAANIFSHDIAVAFRNHVAQQRRAVTVDEEHFRLVTGFNDIFVVIACALLLTSVAWIGAATAFWHKARGRVLAALPSSLQQRLPAFR